MAGFVEGTGRGRTSSRSLTARLRPKGSRLSAESYLITVADAAAHGGRWIISLDDQLAEAIAARIPEALQTWKPFVSGEILNLAARKNQQYRVIPAGKFADSSLNGLRAVLYADVDPPAPDMRKRILAFVQAAGILISGLQWGEAPGTLASGEEHPRCTLRVLGKGVCELARNEALPRFPC